MTPTTVLFGLLLISAAAYYIGLKRSHAVAGGPKRLKDLHSRPVYYGLLTAIWCGVPALVLFSLWQMIDTTIITQLVIQGLPDDLRNLPDARLNLLINDIRNLIAGNIVSREVDPVMETAADRYRQLENLSLAMLAVIMLVAAIMGTVAVLKFISPNLRARNKVERAATVVLVFCSTIAIITTVGIVLSVLFEAIRFFQIIPLPTSCSACRGARKWPSGKTRWAHPAPSEPYPSSPVQCSSPASP
jgi:phosphate transport system permease protein